MVFGFEGMSRAARGAGQGLLQASYVARIVLDSSMVEHAAVNRGVVGSSPTRGVYILYGSVVKRLRHRPFTAVTRVRFPLESLSLFAHGPLAQLVRATGS